MNNLTGTIKGILLLDEKTYQRLLTAENSMRYGVFVLIVCFLIAAFPAFVGNLIDGVQPFTEEDAAAFQNDFLQGFDIAAQFMPPDEDFQLFMDQFRENFAFGTSIAVAVDALPRPLPYAVGGFFQALGNWLSNPFTHLGSWIGYAIWVLLFSKMSGGSGGANRFLGLTALYAVPNLLGLFEFIPLLGSVFVIVGVIWGWIVYIKAVQVSQEFSGAKAVLIVILPILVIVVVTLVITFLLGVSIAGLVSSAQ
jgi:hypothetical protein